MTHWAHGDRDFRLEVGGFLQLSSIYKGLRLGLRPRLEDIKKTPAEGSAVLEIGPGVGALLKMLEKEGYFAVGVDASPPMLYYARRRGAGDAAAGVSFALPAKSERFDGAVALFTVHHWGPHEPSAGEVYRALRPGASLW